MKLSTFLIIKAIISFVFGIPLVLVPGTVVSLYNLALNPAGTLMAQYVGATLTGIGLVCWMARNAASSDLRQGVILSLFIADMVGFIVALLGQLAGQMNALHWVNVAIWLLLAVGLGYFRFLKPSAS